MATASSSTETDDQTAIFFQKLIEAARSENNANQQLRKDHQRRLDMLGAERQSDSSSSSSSSNNNNESPDLCLKTQIPEPPLSLAFEPFPEPTAWREANAGTVHTYLLQKLHWSVEVAHIRPRCRRALESEDAYTNAFEAWYTDVLGAMQNPLDLEDFIRENEMRTQSNAQALEAWKGYSDRFSERMNAWATRFSDLHTELLLDDQEQRYLEALGLEQTCLETFEDRSSWERSNPGASKPYASYNAARRRYLTDNYGESYAVKVRTKQRKSANRNITAAVYGIKQQQQQQRSSSSNSSPENLGSAAASGKLEKGAPKTRRSHGASGTRRT